MSATEWIFQNISEDDDTRSNPNAPSLMQIRAHTIVTRYQISTEAWTSQRGAVSETVTYYRGGIAGEARGPSGRSFRCTSDQADESAQGVEWRKRVQRWESWGDWAAFTPP